MNKNSDSKNAVKLQKQAQKMSKKCSKEELDLFIHSCSIQRLSTKESLEYLKTKGYEISERTFFKRKNRIKQNAAERTTLTIENLVPFHFDRIDTLRLIGKELWKIYHDTKDANLKLKVLNSIRENENMVFAQLIETKTVFHTQIDGYRILPVENKLDFKNHSKMMKDIRIPTFKEQFDVASFSK